MLALKQGLRAGGAPVATAGTALIALLWLGFLWVAHRRIKELAADRPPGLARGRRWPGRCARWRWPGSRRR